MFPEMTVLHNYYKQNNSDLTSLFCMSVNRSGRVKNLTAGVVASDRDREGLSVLSSVLDVGVLLTLSVEVSKSAANEMITVLETPSLMM